MKYLGPLDENEDLFTRQDFWWITNLQIVGAPLIVGSGIDYPTVIPFDGDLYDWWVVMGTGPTGQNAIFELNKNGSAQITIAVVDGLTYGHSSASVSFTAGDKITIDVNQVGSGVAGENANIGLRFIRTA